MGLTDGTTERQATLTWQPDDVARIDDSAVNSFAMFACDSAPISAVLDYWDMWPIADQDGGMFAHAGRHYWCVLSAPRLPDPEMRHDHARIRLVSLDENGGGWRDHGPLLPDGYAPGSREWAGSVVVDADRGQATLYWTAAGGETAAAPRFQQRLFCAHARLVCNDEGITFDMWEPPLPIVSPDNRYYVAETDNWGRPGRIKGLRDPAPFRDAGRTYLVFTGSLLHGDTPWDGCIGLFERTDDGWRALPPPISADGVTNEMERPHIVRHGGRLYLFWSTQAKVFAAGVGPGPTGLYGAVAPSIRGPWTLLNGSGLVSANPVEAPFQAYSWWVTRDLSVYGFADYPSVPADGMVDTPAWRRAHFAGGPAPVQRLVLDNDRARLLA